MRVKNNLTKITKRDINKNIIVNKENNMMKAKKLIVDQSILRLNEEFFRSLLIVNDSLGYLNPQGTLFLFEIKFNETTKVTKLNSALDKEQHRPNI